MFQHQYIHCVESPTGSVASLMHRRGQTRYGGMTDQELLDLLEVQGTHRYMKTGDPGFQKLLMDYRDLNSYLVARSIMEKHPDPKLVLLVNITDPKEVTGLIEAYKLPFEPTYPGQRGLRDRVVSLDLSGLIPQEVKEVFAFTKESSMRNVVMLRDFSSFAIPRSHLV